MTGLKRIKRAMALICLTAMLCMLTACTQDTDATTSAPDGTQTAETTVSDGAETNKETGNGPALENGTVPYIDNDTVVTGELETYHPAEETDVDAGDAIEGDEEAELQQERIAGGAVGDVVSQNLEPLHGIVDPSAGDYVPVYGVNGQ